MKNNVNSYIKIKMLKEYEKQVNYFIGKYNENKLSLTDLIKNIRNLKEIWKYCRVDIKNEGETRNKINFLNKNSNMNINFPSWYKNDKGEGCNIIFKNSQKINVTFNSNNDGELNIHLRGMDYKNLTNQRIKVYYNCKKFMINKEIVFNDSHLVWHNEPYSFTKSIKKTDTINLIVETETIFDYFPQLDFYFNGCKNDKELQIEINKFSNYVNYAMILVKLFEIEEEIFDAMNSLTV